MVGVVVVSHSRPLAESAVELALQMVQDQPPPLRIAAGVEGGGLGTDAGRVAEAIDAVGSDDGVLVLMDLGSAVLSAEMALELRSGRCPVVLSDASLVEGLVGAVVLAAAGASLEEVAAEAGRAAGTKRAALAARAREEAGDARAGAARAPEAPAPAGADTSSVELVLRNEHGLHARPAAALVATLRRFDAEVTVADLTTGNGPVSGRSVSALSTLGAVGGHCLELRATGRQAEEALKAAAALVEGRFGEAAPGAPATPAPPEAPLFPAAGSGIGIGPKRSLGGPPAASPDRARSGPVDGEAEHRRLAEAVARACDGVASARRRVAATAGEAEAAIFDAHLLLLEDEELVGRAHRDIDDGAHTAEEAWGMAVNGLAQRFDALADAYQRARAADVAAVGGQVAARLSGASAPVPDGAGGVMVAPDLTPAQVAALDPSVVDGLVLASGSPLSHAAILARSLGIPVVVGAGEAVLSVPDGTVVVVDEPAGEVVVDPPPEALARYRDRVATARGRAERLLRAAARYARTLDGIGVEVAANVGSAAGAAAAVRNGADSVGLLRTEFLFLDRPAPPGEDEQLAAYTQVAAALGGRRLTVRTLDAGADKPIPYLAATRTASALGSRGIRLSLQEPELFRVQLRALVELGRRCPVSVLFPMVTTVDELVAARRMLEQEAAGALPGGFEVGAMVEIPAFALQARAASGLVDLFSIGTNDLTQYTLAADRGDRSVAHLADPLHPAVLRLIGEVVAGAGERARVAVCGEVAGDPSVTPLLIGLGVRELSVNPPAVPAVKDAVRSTTVARSTELAGRAVAAPSASGVRALLSFTD